jgi:hypothetical protein
MLWQEQPTLAVAVVEAEKLADTAHTAATGALAS